LYGRRDQELLISPSLFADKGETHMESNQPFRLGIIGCGKVTTQRHIPSIRSLGHSALVVWALADTIPGIAEQAAKIHNVKHAFDDYQQLLALEEIDAVSICTPTFTHAKIAIDALRAGKHVYLEKPAAMNEAEMREIVTVARDSGKVFIVGSNGLLQEQMGVCKRMIDNGEIGEVYNVSITRALTRNANDDSRTTRGGDGISMESASHNVEWALYFLGDPVPVSVTGIGYYKYDNLSKPLNQRDTEEVDDCVLALIQFNNGSSFHYKAMRSAIAPSEYEVNIQGDAGLIKYDVHKCYRDKSDDCLQIFTRHPEGHMVVSKPQIKCGRTHAAMYEHFIACMLEDKQSAMSNGDRSIVVMNILDALRESMRCNGKQMIIHER
jgi:predicted dehydrogenase